MSDYYHAQRKRNLFSPDSSEPFTISRSKLDLFFECPRCFYLDVRLGVGRPPGYPFTLNSAVDTLLKREFDHCRRNHIAHRLMIEHDINAIPYECDELEAWRDALRRGVSYHHKPTNLILRGGLDDVWWCPSTGKLIVVDYKATAKAAEVTLDAEWQRGYKRQVEIYQWLLRQNGKDVSDIAVFVYCNGCVDAESFDDCLRFRTKLIRHFGTDEWVEPKLREAKQTLMGLLPKASATCDYCAYRDAASGYEREPEICEGCGMIGAAIAVLCQNPECRWVIRADGTPEGPAETEVVEGE